MLAVQHEDIYLHTNIYKCAYAIVYVCMIKISGKMMDKSDTYKEFCSNISFFIQEFLLANTPKLFVSVGFIHHLSTYFIILSDSPKSTIYIYMYIYIYIYIYIYVRCVIYMCVCVISSGFTRTLVCFLL